MLLILASASPRRQDLIAQLGYPFRIQPSQIDEAAVTATLTLATPVQVAQHLALAKARDVAAQVLSGTSDLDLGGQPAERVVIGADTVVDLNGLLLGKPENREDARRMLGLLRGVTHQVHTGLAVIALSAAGTTTLLDDLPCVSTVVTAQVEMRPYSAQEIDDYVSSGEPLDKAGAYAIQGIGASMVATHHGSIQTIIGLPLDELRVCLQQVRDQPEHMHDRLRQ